MLNLKREAHPPSGQETAMGSEAVPMGHYDEQSVTLGKSSASTSRRHDHVHYFVWRQVFTAAAGAV